MKRAAAEYGLALPATKAQHTAPPEGQGETWECKACGNVNWPLRTTCNRKGCGALGPWTCSACSNQNFQGRAVCNRKGCAQPHPGGANHAAAFSPVAFAGGKGAKGAAGMQGLISGGAGAPPGSWCCPGCNNVNWPLRTTCNNKTCGLPRAAAEQAVPGAPAGSWTCKGCQNVNWPLRSTCNNKSCGLPRDQADGGPPARAAVTFGRVIPPAASPAGSWAGRAAPGGDPAGSWVCTVCGNTNWPLRTTCNQKNCGLPRDQVDGGPAPAAAAPAISAANGAGAAAPEGSWGCPSCGNVNWPLRSVCNKKGCGLPRPS